MQSHCIMLSAQWWCCTDVSADISARHRKKKERLRQLTAQISLPKSSRLLRTNLTYYFCAHQILRLLDISKTSSTRCLPVLTISTKQLLCRKDWSHTGTPSPHAAQPHLCTPAHLLLALLGDLQCCKGYRENEVAEDYLCVWHTNPSEAALVKSRICP